MNRYGLLLVIPFILLVSCETVPTQSEMEYILDLLEADETISIMTPPEETALPSEGSPPEESVLIESISEEGVSEEPLSEGPFIAEQAFDPNNVSQDLYETTKAHIQDLIERLDNIIRARNYNAWLEYLSDSYRQEISSSGFLEARTEELHIRNQRVARNLGRDPRTLQKVVLRTIKDYFDNVVVPSRANDRVDDIAFISETKVRAYMVDGRGNRLILYDLEMIGGSWKIIG